LAAAPNSCGGGPFAGLASRAFCNRKASRGLVVIYDLHVAEAAKSSRRSYPETAVVIDVNYHPIGVPSPVGETRPTIDRRSEIDIYETDAAQDGFGPLPANVSIGPLTADQRYQTQYEL
jgi:hypothetical protein